jgi:hypothetical protein
MGAKKVSGAGLPTCSLSLTGRDIRCCKRTLELVTSFLIGDYRKYDKGDFACLLTGDGYLRILTIAVVQVT